MDPTEALPLPFALLDTPSGLLEFQVGLSAPHPWFVPHPWSVPHPLLDPHAEPESDPQPKLSSFFDFSAGFESMLPLGDISPHPLLSLLEFQPAEFPQPEVVIVLSQAVEVLPHSSLSVGFELQPPPS